MSETMTYRRHAAATLTLGLPLIGGHVAQIAIELTDTIMMGWYSVAGLAAIVLGSTLFFVMFIFGSGFAWAVMPLVASAEAEGDEILLRRVTRMGLWLSALFGALCLPLFWWSGPLLLFMGQVPETAAGAQDYLRIAGWGIVPALAVMVLKSYLAALGRTQIVLWITLLAAAVNVGLNWVLIFGNLGAPELGIRGAAIASVSVQVVSLVGVVIYALAVLPQHDLFRRLWRPDGAVFARVARMGVPIGFTNLAEVGIFAASSVMMGWLGTVPLAAHGIALQLTSLIFMVHVGLSNAATIRAGTAFGRRDAAHLHRGALVVTAMSMLVAGLTVTVLLTMPEPLIGLFLDADEPARDAIIGIGVTLLAIAALFQVVDAAQVMALGLLRGVQDTTVPMVMAVVSYWLIGVPVGYLLGFGLGWGGIGIWLGLSLGLALAAAMMMWRFWGGRARAVAMQAEVRAARIHD